MSLQFVKASTSSDALILWSRKANLIEIGSWNKPYEEKDLMEE